MSDDEDVPPLEDMSELLRQTEALREKPVPDNRTESREFSKETYTAAKSSEVKHNEPKPKQEKPQTFGGMKKGFLFSNSNKKLTKAEVAPVKETTHHEDVPLIKATKPEDKKKQLEMPEVQAAMKANEGLLQDKSWVTDDLLSKVEKNETLLKCMADPRFMQALSEFQTDPQAAMMKYQNNSEVQNFLKEFCALMGDHFTKMGPSETKSPPVGSKSREPLIKMAQGADISARSSTNPKQTSTEDDNRVQEILNNPEMAQILMDPEIQRFMQCIRVDPNTAQRMLQRGGLAFQGKVKKLVDNGLLQIQR